MELIKENKVRVGSLAWLMICSFILFFGAVCVKKYYCFEYNDMDLAAYNQIMWNLTHGSLFSSILGVNFLGHHAHFILFLIAPLYFLIPHPLTLVFLQLICLSLAAYPVFLIARSELNEKFALAIVFCYLVYPAMNYTALYEFHVPVLATLFLSWMFYFYIKNNFKFFVLFMALSLLCQENIPLVVAPFGIFAAFEKKRFKWTLTPLLLGLFWFLILTAWIMPYFNKGTLEFSTIYRQLGNSLPEIIATIATKPLLAAKILFTAPKIMFLFKLFAPLCFLPLFDGRILISAVLFFQHLLSNRLPEYMIEYHYDAELLPFIFISLVYGIKRIMNFSFLKKYIRIEIIIALLLAITLTCAISFGPLPEVVFAGHVTNKEAWDYQRERLISLIPAWASVVATFDFLPMLSSRQQVYSFHHVIHGFYTLSTKQYKLPKGVEYALLDVNELRGFGAFYKQGRSELNMRNFLAENKWGLVEMLGNIALLKNDYPGKEPLFGIIKKIPDNIVTVNGLVNNELLFLGYDEGEGSEILMGLRIPLKFYWQASEKMATDYRMNVEIKDASGKTRESLSHPLCYRILPTYLWNKDIIIEENYNLFVPQPLRREGFFVDMSITDAKSGEVVPIEIIGANKKTASLGIIRKN